MSTCISPYPRNQAPLRSNTNQCFFNALRAVKCFTSKHASTHSSLSPYWCVMVSRWASKNGQKLSIYSVTSTGATAVLPVGGAPNGKDAEPSKSPPSALPPFTIRPWENGRIETSLRRNGWLLVAAPALGASSADVSTYAIARLSQCAIRQIKRFNVSTSPHLPATIGYLNKSKYIRMQFHVFFILRF